MIVHYFENNNRNVRGTAKKFNIQPKQLRDWSNKKGTLLTTAPHVAKLHLGKPAKYPKLEDDLFAWISEKRANGNAITQKIITNKAISLSKSPEFLANNLGIAGFKFSSKWLDGFLGRYDLSEHRRTMVAQQLPSDLIEKQNIFLSYVMYLRIHNKYELKYMGNMDETPMWFDLPSNTTINQKGAKTVNICTTGHE
ncbi:pogo transposable element with KRAB domain [Rhizophagus clarus]|uniref:Pogo transposable element with KRAB domain n=1 Tax=Rhizophagus clarus TaxID=94130 RepID=A0A8H3QP25_9GLOM|nr:pogo transposable element with KRAB domain [Rhizophagus clarus]